MVATPRNVESYSSSLVVPPGKTPMQFREDPSAKLAWMQLRQLTDDGHTGLALFNGTRREKNTLFNDLRNYVRQAKTYWDAASRTDGSAAALPLYYAMLNLAKAELLQIYPPWLEHARKRLGVHPRGPLAYGKRSVQPSL